MKLRDLEYTVNSILEPRLLLAEDALSDTISNSRTALDSWRMLQIYRRHETKATKLSEVKHDFGLAIHELSEGRASSIRTVHEGLLKKLDNFGLNLSDDGSDGERENKMTHCKLCASSSNASIDDSSEGKTKNSNAEEETTNKNGNICSCQKTGIDKHGKERLMRRKQVALWKKPFVLDKDGDGRVSSYEKAWCIASAAWVLAVVGFIVTSTILSYTFTKSLKTKSVEFDRVVVKKADLPRLVWCHPEENAPAFFDPIDPKYHGFPIFAMQHYKNIETGVSVYYPKTRELFEEVIVADGSTRERKECKKRLQAFDPRYLKERTSRGPNTLRCRVCLRTRQDVSMTTINPKSSVNLTSSTGMLYSATSSRLLTSCLRRNYKASAEQTYFAFYRLLAKNLKKLQERQILDVSEIDASNFKDEASISNFMQILSYGTGSDPTGSSFYTFMCNIVFFAGYFYPIVSETSQRWKFDRVKGLFVGSGPGFYYTSSLEPASEEIPPGVPSDPSFDFPHFLDDEMPTDSPVSRDVAPDNVAPDASLGDGRLYNPPPLEEDLPPYKIPVAPRPFANQSDSPFSPVSNVYTVNSLASARIFSAKSAKRMTTIGASSYVELRLKQGIEPNQGRTTFLPGYTSIVRTEDLRGNPDNERIGYFHYSLAISFEDYVVQRTFLRSSYTTSQFCADILNLAGIFFGGSVLSAIVVPGSSLVMYTSRLRATNRRK